jgi:hypothetical protein
MSPHNTILLFSACVSVGSLAAQQQVTLPDNHYLCENPTQVGSSGSTLWWRAASPSRFQLLYEASHFTSAAVTGPITITKIKFRGEDSETNLGGQVYNNITLEVGSTSLAAAALTTAFATNRTGATMSLVGTTNVTVAPSAGTTPNNWNIVLDLVAMGIPFTYDPTSAQPNLLIDVNMPTSPINAPPLAMIAMTNTTGTTATIRGNGLTATAAGALTGTLNPTPIVVGVEFTGPGGYTTVIPAVNEAYGGACGGDASSFYQGFVDGQAFDLGGGLTMVPDNPTAPLFYTVTSGAAPPDLTQVNASPDSILDDGIVNFALGFTFPYPGGSTTTIGACTNGFVWLDPAMLDTQFAAVADRLLGNPVNPGPVGPAYSGARHAIFWTDLNMQRNVGLNPICGLHVRNDLSGGPGAGVCYVTWWDIATFNVVGGVGVQGHVVWTFQMVLHEDGLVEYRYGSVPVVCGASTVTANCYAVLVGFSPGRIGGLTGVNAVDPQNRDLSLETPFFTRPEGSRGNVGQIAVATPNAGGAQYGGRLYFGQTVRWNASNVPPGTILGAQLLDVAATRPGLQLPTITAPGCMLSTTANAVLWEIFVLPPSSATGTVPLVVPNGLWGAVLCAQFVGLDGLFTGGDLISFASNAIQHTVGLN